VPRFKAFISYKHVKSSRFAENLELAIKAYAKPIYRPPMAVFRDEKYLVPGADLSVKITRALEDSEFEGVSDLLIWYPLLEYESDQLWMGIP
jgi:hypothetical protein